MGIINNLRVATRLGTIESLSQSGYATSPVIFSHQNAPEPSVPYCVINPLIINQIGRSEISTFTDDGYWVEDFDGDTTYTGDEVFEATAFKSLHYKITYESQIQFTFAGSNAEDLAFYFHNAVCNNRTISFVYRKNGLSPMRKSTLRRSPQKRDTQWVDFWNVDVTFLYTVITKQDVDWVDSLTEITLNPSH
ncbi:hypothetical protein D3C85_1040910 [compost metagenome]